MKRYIELHWKKNKHHDKEISSLLRRPNIVRTTIRALSAGMSFFLIYNTAFSLYNHHEQRKFIEEGKDVLYRAESVLDSLQQERSYLLPSGKGSALDQVVAELHALRRDLLGSSCVAPPVLERGQYVADAEGCLLSVTIPEGGSLSEASELYFGNPRRWQSDLRYNAHIDDPDVVPAGMRYRFSLR